jgi:hypothetical protein
MSAWPPADLVGLLEGDSHGCALATAVRAQDGDIIDFTLDLLDERDPAAPGIAADEPDRGVGSRRW